MNAHQVNSMVNKLDAFQRDMKKEQRLAAQECKTCFYLNNERLACQAFWTWHCGICATQAQSSNSAHPRLCKVCAIAHSLCMECGADIDDVQRRKTL